MVIFLVWDFSSTFRLKLTWIVWFSFLFCSNILVYMKISAVFSGGILWQESKSPEKSEIQASNIPYFQFLPQFNSIILFAWHVIYLVVHYFAVCYDNRVSLKRCLSTQHLISNHTQWPPVTFHTIWASWPIHTGQYFRGDVLWSPHWHLTVHLHWNRHAIYIMSRAIL